MLSYILTATSQIINWLEIHINITKKSLKFYFDQNSKIENKLYFIFHATFNKCILINQIWNVDFNMEINFKLTTTIIRWYVFWLFSYLRLVFKILVNGLVCIFRISFRYNILSLMREHTTSITQYIPLLLNVYCGWDMTNRNLKQPI